MFSHRLLFVQKVLAGETIFRHSDTVASPAKLVLHYHCLDTSCVGFHEDTGIGAAIFPSYAKYLSETRLVEFLHGLHKISISNPRLAPAKYSGNTNGFVDHHFGIFPEVMIMEHSFSQFPERCVGTANTVLNCCFNRSFNVAWSGLVYNLGVSYVDGESYTLICLCTEVKACLKLFCCVAQSSSYRRSITTVFITFVLALRRLRLKSFSSSL